MSSGKDKGTDKRAEDATFTLDSPLDQRAPNGEALDRALASESRMKVFQKRGTYGPTVGAADTERLHSASQERAREDIMNATEIDFRLDQVSPKHVNNIININMSRKPAENQSPMPPLIFQNQTLK